MTALLPLLVLACEPPPPPAPEPTASREAVVLIVLDTVRSSELSLCGYERPTSPHLQRLAAHQGASFSCRAMAPGSWTLPTHASWFTGLMPPLHGAEVAAKGVTFEWGGVASPMSKEPRTLAEDFAGRGFDTMVVSANPVLTDASGLARGFRLKRVSPNFMTFRHDGVVRALAGALEEVQGDRLFAVINIADAHLPLGPIPEDHPWLPARPRLHTPLEDESNVDTRYLRGQLDEAEVAALQGWYRDVYDFGTAQADHTLGRVLGLLTQTGWLADDYRVVITSDHGEYLAERGLLGHGSYLFEENNRVPLVVVRSGGRPLDLPELVSGLQVHTLLREGALSPEAGVPLAVGLPSTTKAKVARGYRSVYDLTHVAAWDGDDKVVLHGEDLVIYDLASDPGELAPKPLEDHPLAPTLRSLHRRIVGFQADASGDDGLHEALQELGYAD